MKIITKNPDARLKSLIKQMWIIEENGSLDIDVKSFPVGYSFINVINGNHFNIIQDSNRTQTYSYLAGPLDSPFTLGMTFIKRALMVQLQPFAIPILFSMPADEFHDHVLPLADFNAKLATYLEELIFSELTSNQVLEKTSRIFMDMMGDQHLDMRIPTALACMLESKGKVPISKLAHEVNVSQRRLQQLFQYYFGLPAKTYARIIRMQHHTFQWLNGTDMDVVIPDGYYDQSHFIHDLKRQTGMLPGEFFDYVTHERNKPAYLTSNIYHE